MNRFSFLWGILCLVFSALFIADLQGSFTSQVQNPIAELRSLEGTVRRLPKDKLTWDRVAEQAKFGVGDTVSTGEAGKAKLFFFAGGELELGPGAMVVLSGSVQELELAFVTGTGRVRVTEKARSKLQVTERTEVAQLKTTEQQTRIPARVEITTVAEAEMKAISEAVSEVEKVEAPKSSLITAALREEELKDAAIPKFTREGLLFDEEDKKSSVALPLAPVLVFPQQMEDISLRPGENLRLKWEPPVKDPNRPMPVAYELIIAKAENSQEVHREKIRGTEWAFDPVRFGTGAFNWRIRSIADGGAFSSEERSRIFEITPFDRKNELGKKLKAPVSEIAPPRILPVRVE